MFYMGIHTQKTLIEKIERGGGVLALKGTDIIANNFFLNLRNKKNIF